MLDLSKGTDPIRNGHWWTKERFYLVSQRPSCHIDWKIGRLRIRSWAPRSFISFSWEMQDRPPEHAGKFRAWQFYFGWGKCDGTRTRALRRGDFGGTLEERERGYVLTWTFTEMIAVRKRDLDLMPSWDNMAGS